jgi:outer membrane receptor for ferrienterochelin and colicin
MSARITAFLLGALLAAASPATPQTTLAALLGTVTDSQKAVLPGTTVTATNVDTQIQATAVTDANGRFRVSALRPGTYDIRAELSGFAVQVRNRVQLFVGAEVTIDFELSVAGVQETVTVSGESPLVEVTKSEVSTIVDRRQIDALPLSGRDFSDLMRLTPGVVDGLVAGQQSSASNTYLVDGVSNDRAWTGGNRTGFSAETIREFRVITEQFAAEYGQASGGVVNVVSRSGTNRFENRVYLYNRGEGLDKKNYFATSKAPYTRRNFGGFSGGPIARNRLFYLGSYEGTRVDQTAIVTVPATVGKSGQFSQPTRSHVGFVKMDTQLNPSHAWSVRFAEQRSDSTNSGVGGRSTWEYGSTSWSRNHDFTSSLTSVLGSSRLNEVRVLVADRPADTVPNGSGPELLFASSNQGKSYSDPQGSDETRFQIADNFSWHVAGKGGEHNIKMGVDYNRTVLDGNFCNYCDGSFTFPKDYYDPNDRNTWPTNYTQRIGSTEYRIPNISYSAFLQDSWRPRKNVTVNAGLRFDRVDYAGTLTTSDFSPRLALTFDPTGNGKTVYNLGGGIFKDKITLNQWLIIVLNVINATNFVVITNPGYPDWATGASQGYSLKNTEMFDPNLGQPYSVQATGGMKHDFGNGFAAGASYLFNRGIHQIRRRDMNAPINGGTVRPDPTMGRKLIHEGTGLRTYHGLILNAERRFGERWRFTAAYTLSSSKSDSEARNSTSLPTDQYNLHADWAPADNDARHNLVLTGQVTLPFAIQASAIYQYRSAYPFNVASGRDTNNDSRSGDRPDPDPSGKYPTNGVTAFGTFSIPVTRPGTLARNAFRGPEFARLDVRLSKIIGLGGKRRVEVLAEAFNITNRVNYNSYTSSIQSSLFGKPQSAGSPLQGQLGVRFDF